MESQGEIFYQTVAIFYFRGDLVTSSNFLCTQTNLEIRGLWTDLLNFRQNIASRFVKFYERSSASRRVPPPNRSERKIRRRKNEEESRGYSAIIGNRRGNCRGL